MSTNITTVNGKEIKTSGLRPHKSTSATLQDFGFKQTTLVDKALIILLDKSGSMGEKMGTEEKMTASWRVLQYDLAPNMAGWSYGLLLFPGSRGVLDSCDWEIPMTDDTSKLLQHKKPYPSGGTPMKEGMYECYLMIRTHVKQARIILISDGCPDNGPEEILRLASDYKSIPIDTIGIGNKGSWSYDPEFLRKLSDLTGGLFSEASSVKMLSDTILKLSPKQRPLLGTVKGV